MALPKEKISLVKPLLEEFPNIKIISPSRLNWSVLSYVKQFVSRPDVLTTSLVQNITEKSNGIAEARRDFDNNVAYNLRILNRMHNLDDSIIDDYGKFKDLIVLFLANFKILFDESGKNKKADSFFTRANLRYGLKLLEKNDISELRSDLEDNFFQFLDPKTFDYYNYLLKFTRRNYFIREKDIIDTLKPLLKENSIDSEVQSRLKSIYSIHKKITKKNILFSQVLDTIGLRIIVKNETQCYRTMGLIVSRWPVLNNRIRDYVAIPKENGYKSIHLTIIFEETPVEIQIRTRQMHQEAQYGKAAHNEYKNGNS